MTLKLRAEAQTKLDNATLIERLALSKLEKAEKLMTEAALRLSNAKRVEELSNFRQKRLDQAYVRLNKTKQIIERRELEQKDHDLFVKDNLAQL